MTHGSLFSGVGGFDLAAEWCGWQNLWHCEIDPFANRVLSKNFPNIPNYGDITKADWASAPAPDVISGGFPCQPFSQAGKRRGKADDRYLWPAMLEVISTLRPTWVVGENVAGFIGMGLDDALSDLEAEGYETWTCVLPACAVGAPHRRDRVWIVGYSNDKGTQKKKQQVSCGSESSSESSRSDGIIAYTSSPRLPWSEQPGALIKSSGPSRPITQLNGHEWPEAAARICRVDDGIPRRLDRGKRIKALGNAIVPQVAYQIFQAILSTQMEHQG